MPLIKRKHATAKAYIHDWLEPDEGGGFNGFSFAIVALVLISLASLAIETEASRPTRRSIRAGTTLSMS